MAQEGGFDYYKALDVDDKADETTIKKAYRKLVLRWHPDKHPEDREQAEEKIRQINAAYEILSNPTKKEAYDQQRRAVLKRQSGVAPNQAMSISPRMRIPKEFFVQPMGYPEKFIRTAGRRAFVYGRKDVKADFQAFFADCKFSLWWLPEVNNMCRVRVMGSRGRGEELAAATGVAGGLNLAFELGGTEGLTESEVTLMEARKGQKTERVNFIAVTSPVYENAFRFEVAHYRNFYLTFSPPTHLRVMPYEDSEDTPNVIDFMLVDFSAMFKFIDIEEVLLPSVAQHGGWVPLSTLRADPNVKTYFQNILGRPVWDVEDFVIYFEGHWTLWEYRPQDQSVRVRPPAEKLGQLLQSARNMDDVASAIAGAGDELQLLSLQATVRALQVLSGGGGGAAPGAAPGAGGGAVGMDVIAAVNRVAAHKKIFGALRSIVSNAQLAKSPEFNLKNLLSAISMIEVLGGENANADFVSQRNSALLSVSDLVMEQVTLGSKAFPGFEVRLEDMGSILKLPGLGSREDRRLAEAFQSVLEDAPLQAILQVGRDAMVGECPSVADTAATLALSKLRGIDDDEAMRTLKAIADSGRKLEEVAEQARIRTARASTSALAGLASALAEKGVASGALSEVAEHLATKSLADLTPEQLLALAVAATKSKALGPDVVGAVARAASSSTSAWSAGDLIRLLLAAAKAKGGPIQEDAKAALLQGAAVVITPQLSSLAAIELVKLVLAVACHGSSPLMEAAGKEVLARLSDFLPAQLLLLTQGLVQGLGSTHPTLVGVLDFWFELISEAATGGSEEYNPLAELDCVSQRRREIERSRALTADQLAKLSQIVAPALSGSSGRDSQFFEVIGSRLLTLSRELTPAGRTSLEAQLADRMKGLGKFSGRSKLLKAIADSQRRSASRSRSRSNDRDRYSRSGGGERSTSDRGGRRSRSRGRRR
eukprot:TRINITY_DN20637_c0_g1_i1.p1 TRINITY_DN20637_c0_g1~~TRINITY_DN20637_c0_g1_i1.p1  ORF type:complete len:937 (-),score=207.08 TRINITY_DN20637_c0_g1_i1:47-2857(-)